MEHEHQPNAGCPEHDQRHRHREKLIEEAQQLTPDTVAELVEKIDHVLREAALESLSTGRPLEHRAARLASFVLLSYAAGYDEPTMQLMNRALESGYGSHAELREVYQKIHEMPEADPTIATFADFLGTYLIDREHPKLHPRPSTNLHAVIFFPSGGDLPLHGIGYAHDDDLNPPQRETVQRRLVDHVVKEGEGFRAYLRVPGVDVLARGTMNDFRRRYIGTVSSSDQLPPRDHLGAQDWDAVELGGQIHVFTR